MSSVIEVEVEMQHTKCFLKNDFRKFVTRKYDCDGDLSGQVCDVTAAHSDSFNISEPMVVP